MRFVAHEKYVELYFNMSIAITIRNDKISVCNIRRFLADPPYMVKLESKQQVHGLYNYQAVYGPHYLVIFTISLLSVHTSGRGCVWCSFIQSSTLNFNWSYLWFWMINIAESCEYIPWVFVQYFHILPKYIYFCQYIYWLISLEKLGQPGDISSIG